MKIRLCHVSWAQEGLQSKVGSLMMYSGFKTAGNIVGKGKPLSCPRHNLQIVTCLRERAFSS